MSSEDSHWASEALRRVEQELQAAERDLEQAHMQVAVINERLHGLHQTREGLMRLLDEQSFLDKLKPSSRAVERQLRNEFAHGIRPPTRRQPLNSSTMRLIQTLLESDHGLSPEEIVDRFDRPGWNYTEAAVQQALRRAQGYGFVRQSAANTYFSTRAGRAALHKAAVEEASQPMLDMLNEQLGKGPKELP